MQKYSLRKLKKFSFLFGTTVCICVLWALGVLDYFSEISFEEFRWYPDVDVKEQVRLLLDNKPPSSEPINNWNALKPETLPACLFNGTVLEKNFLLIAVKSSATNILTLNFQYREAIRKTWGRTKFYSGFHIRVIFLIANLKSNDANRYGAALQEERRRHNDLLVGNFYDGYFNNTYKFLNAIQYANNFCDKYGTVPFALLVDDDYMVSIPNLIKEIKNWKSTDRLYMGWRFDSKPFRLRFHRYRVSLSVYPYDRYPPYITAGAVLLSGQAIREIYSAVQFVKLFLFDDIYMGIIAYLIRLPPIHNKQMHFHYYWIRNADAAEFVCVHGYSGDFLQKTYERIGMAS
uniref:Hexosyltransferase n=1 Tax=Syphacia muris TaxID=451379 RepID=A0A0N5ATC8_9BILA